MSGFQRLLRSILKRGKSGYGESVSSDEAHRVAMNGTRQQCLVLTRQRHLDDKTLELLARRRFDDVRPLVVWHGSMTTKLARRLLRIHDPSLRDLLLQRFPEIESDAAEDARDTEDAADGQDGTTITYVTYSGSSVGRPRPPHEDRPQDSEFVDPAAPDDIGELGHPTVDATDEDGDVHGVGVLADGPSEPSDERAPSLPTDDGGGGDSDAPPASIPAEQPPSEAGPSERLEPTFDLVDPEPTNDANNYHPAEPSVLPTSRSIDDENEAIPDDWDADDLELLLDIAAANRLRPEAPAPRQAPVRRKDVVDEDDYAELSLHRILEYVPTGHEATELAARIADKRLGSLLTWLTRFREAGRSPDEIVVAWHVRKTWNELRPMSSLEYPISWATTFRLLDSMPGVPDSGAALDILERIERRWRRHARERHTSLSAYIDRVLQDYAASGGNVPIDALFQ